MMNFKGRRDNRLWHIFEGFFLPGTGLKGMRKLTKTVNIFSGCSGQDSSEIYYEY
jgi:hypothetical protein